MDQQPAGLYVPLLTPYTASGQLAPAPLEALAHRMIDAGAAGLVVFGTTGEHAAVRLPLVPARRAAADAALAQLAGLGVPAGR